MRIKKELKARYDNEYAKLQKAVNDFNGNPTYSRLGIAEDARFWFAETCMEIMVEIMGGDTSIIAKID
jgi:hypothetical protein